MYVYVCVFDSVCIIMLIMFGIIIILPIIMMMTIRSKQKVKLIRH